MNRFCFTSILCGDIDRNGKLDGPNSNNVVVTGAVSAATVVDGFVISGGNDWKTKRRWLVK